MSRLIRIFTRPLSLSFIVMMITASLIITPTATASSAETTPSKTVYEMKVYGPVWGTWQPLFTQKNIQFIEWDQFNQWFNVQVPSNVPTAPVEKPTPAPSIPSEEVSNQSWEQQVVDLVNIERAKVGLPALQHDSSLSKVAAAKSRDMRDRNYFSHDSPTYGSPFDMMRQFGVEYRSAGENIAAGQRSPKEVMEAWMNSPGHRQNILSNQFTHIGVGVAEGGSYGIYWTQMFVGK